MAVWELALLLVAMTFMMVNIVSVVVQLKMITMFKDWLPKIAEMGAKSMDVMTKSMEKLAKDLDEE